MGAVEGHQLHGTARDVHERFIQERVEAAQPLSREAIGQGCAASDLGSVAIGLLSVFFDSARIDRPQGVAANLGWARDHGNKSPVTDLADQKPFILKDKPVSCPVAGRTLRTAGSGREARDKLHHRLLTHGQEFCENLVAQKPAAAGQAEPVREPFQQASTHEAIDLIAKNCLDVDAKARAKCRIRNTLLHQAQAEHHELAHRNAAPDGFAVSFGACTRLHALDVLRHRPHVPPAAVALEAVRARAEAKIGLVMPVDQIVAAPAPGPRPVGDLILFVARGRKSIRRQEVAICRKVIARRNL